MRDHVLSRRRFHGDQEHHHPHASRRQVCTQVLVLSADFCSPPATRGGTTLHIKGGYTELQSQLSCPERAAADRWHPRRSVRGHCHSKSQRRKEPPNARALFDSELQTIFDEREEGWKQRTLEEVATSFGRGRSRHRPRNAPHLYDGKYPFVQTGDIRNAEHLLTNYSQTYNEFGFAQSKLWPKGTVCITIAANVAETAILGINACFPDSVIGLVPNPEKADGEFIEYLLQSFKARLQSLGKGSAQDNINMGTFESQHFPFPCV